MNTLHMWARRWGIPPAALAELAAVYSPPVTEMPEGETSEAAVISRVRLEFSNEGIVLFRNNVGAATDASGRHIRYGLANESKAMSGEYKSADLIGVRPVRIEPDHVGRVLGQFVARECKRANWNYSGTPRERAQRKFLELIAGLGGDAKFATGEGTL